MSMHAMIISSSLTIILAAAAIVTVLLQEILADLIEKPKAHAEARTCVARVRAQSIARDWAAFCAIPANEAR